MARWQHRAAAAAVPRSEHAPPAQPQATQTTIHSSPRSIVSLEVVWQDRSLRTERVTVLSQKACCYIYSSRHRWWFWGTRYIGYRRILSNQVCYTDINLMTCVFMTAVISLFCLHRIACHDIVTCSLTSPSPTALIDWRGRSQLLQKLVGLQYARLFQFSFGNSFISLTLPAANLPKWFWSKFYLQNSAYFILRSDVLWSRLKFYDVRWDVIQLRHYRPVDCRL